MLGLCAIILVDIYMYIYNTVVPNIPVYVLCDHTVTSSKSPGAYAE